jgi:hypothetical protein
MNSFYDYFNKKYCRECLYTDIKVDSKTYRLLKQFYTYYNHDNQTKIIPQIKVKEVLKTITLEDLITLKYGDNYEISKRLIDSQSLIKDNISNIVSDKDELQVYVKKPVEWWTFISFMQSIIVEKKYSSKQSEDLVKDLYEKMKERKVDLKAYQRRYRNTFYKIFMKTVKDMFTVQNDPDFLINKEYKF